MSPKVKCAAEEYQRLLAELGVDSLADNKKILVEKLVAEASFLITQLEVLRGLINDHGAIQINRNGRQKQTECSKHYIRSVITLASLMKNINSIIGNSADNETDELEKFLAGM